MKKISLAALLTFFASAAFAQIEIGLKLSPSLAGNRVVAEQRHNMESTSARARIGFGVLVDYFFTENYAFSTGLNYTSKGSGTVYNTTPDDNQAIVRRTDRFSLQYIELPLMMKLYTNEIATDTKLYFHLGPSLNTNIAAKVNDQKILPGGQRATKRFNLFEVSAILGTGAEWQLGQTTRVFGGIAYHRGLTNIDNAYGRELNDRNISIRSDAFILDLGLKF
jgi:hypothetical protein